MTVTTWRGCRLAARNASFWHGAHDFAPATLCGMPLAGSGMSESHATGSMRECPACARVAEATVSTVDVVPTSRNRTGGHP